MRLLPLMLLVVCCYARAEWVPTGETETLIRFIDLDNVVESGQFRRVWTLSNYFEVDEEFGFHSIRAYSEFDCKEARSRVLQEEFWSKHWATGAIMRNPFTYPRNWQFHAPGTIGHDGFKRVCLK
jgi:hypothetical protein